MNLLDVIPKVSTVAHAIRYECQLWSGSKQVMVEREAIVGKVTNPLGYALETLLNCADIRVLDAAGLKANFAVTKALLMVETYGQEVPDVIIAHPDSLPRGVYGLIPVECDLIPRGTAIVGAFATQCIMRTHASDDTRLAFYIKRPPAFCRIERLEVYHKDNWSTPEERYATGVEYARRAIEDNLCLSSPGDPNIADHRDLLRGYWQTLLDHIQGEMGKLGQEQVEEAL